MIIKKIFLPFFLSYTEALPPQMGLVFSNFNRVQKAREHYEKHLQQIQSVTHSSFSSSSSEVKTAASEETNSPQERTPLPAARTPSPPAAQSERNRAATEHLASIFEKSQKAHRPIGHGSNPQNPIIWYSF